MAQKQLVKIFAVKAVEASVWLRSPSDKGDSRFEISLARSYRGSDGWHRSNRFYPDDLPRLRAVLDEAYRYTALRTVEPRQEKSTETTRSDTEGGGDE